MKINDISIFYLCNDFERSLGLEKLIPNFHIICIDFNNGVLNARKEGVKIFCLEEELKEINPIFRNSNKLLNHPKVQEYIEKNSLGKDKTYLMFFKIAPNIEATAKELGYKVINSSAKLNQIFEHKISQYEQLSSLNYFPHTRVSKLKDISFKILEKELSLPFVIQYDRGHTGSSTVFINNLGEFESEQKLYPERIAKFSKYINGDAWTINACTTRMGTLYGGLSYQITGLENCTSKKGATVGNDWTKELDSDVQEQLRLMTEDIGERMYNQGFKGMFGIDIVVENGLAYLIEVNARQTASVSMHTKLMLKDEQIPLEILHIAEYISRTDQEYIDNINTILGTKYTLEELSSILKSQNIEGTYALKGSQIILRNTNSEETKVKGELKTGIYKYENNKLVYVRDGYSIDNIINDDEYCIMRSRKRTTIQTFAFFNSKEIIEEILK